MVEILEVCPPAMDSDLRLACSLGLPRVGKVTRTSGTKGPTYGLDVAGWVLGRSSPAVAVEVTQDDILIQRIPLATNRSDVAAVYPHVPNAETSGFQAVINTVPLPPDFDLLLRVVYEGEQVEELASIRGRRARLHSGFEPRLRPLMVTTLGRTGSTAFMNALEAHPEVVGCKAFQYDAKAANYWISVLSELSEPASYLRQVSTGSLPGLGERGWWLGDRLPQPAGVYGEPDLQQWLGGDPVQAVASFCQRQIEAFYERFELDMDHSGTYFAENFQPNLSPWLVWELYPGAREVILVRDFRDVVASILSFNAKRGYNWFGRDQIEDESEYITWFGYGVWSLLKSWQRRAAQAHLIRYEDLIANPKTTISSLLDYLELDAGEASMEPMVRGLTERSSLNDDHRTVVDPRASIGRWQIDLSPKLQRASEDAFGPALDVFGYR